MASRQAKKKVSQSISIKYLRRKRKNIVTELEAFNSSKYHDVVGLKLI
jgi:hypothetical protein